MFRCLASRAPRVGLKITLEKKPVTISIIRRGITGSDLEGLKNVRSQRNRKNLENVLKRKTKQRTSRAIKTRDKSARERKLMEEKGFDIVDEPGISTVSMIKRGPDGEETVRCEFEGYRKPQNDDESAIIMLFDIIVSRKGKSGSLVFTCTPEPSPMLLSVRFVPTGKSHLDQDVFDGPSSDKVPTKINAALFSFLKDHGIDDEVMTFIKNYSLIKYEQEALEGISFASSFVAAVSP